jgi:hypothetical protein
MRRLVVFLFAGSVVAMWIFASQDWAASDIVDSATRVSITGLETYPQLTFILLAWSLILFIGAYIKTFFGKFLVSAISILLFATAAPVWFESASGSLAILSIQIAEVTGVSGWSSQTDLLNNPTYNHIAADLFVIALIIGLISSLLHLWIGIARSESKALVTRIDNLPRW